jgi:hypothetical protein
MSDELLIKDRVERETGITITNEQAIKIRDIQYAWIAIGIDGDFVAFVISEINKMARSLDER